MSRTRDLCDPAPMQKRGRLPINHECRGPSCHVVDLQAPQLLFGQRLQRTDMSPLGGVPKMGDCSLRDDNRELQGSHFCGDSSESPSMTDPKGPAQELLWCTQRLSPWRWQRSPSHPSPVTWGRLSPPGEWLLHEQGLQALPLFCRYSKPPGTPPFYQEHLQIPHIPSWFQTQRVI